MENKIVNKETGEHVGNINKNWLYKIKIMKILDLGFTKQGGK